MSLVHRIEKVDAPFDLKFVGMTTASAAWFDVLPWWKRAPLSLRWLTVATEDYRWLAYNDLYCRATEDLRYLSVMMNDMRWLYFCPVWRSIDLKLKERAIAEKNPNLLRDVYLTGPRFDLWETEAIDDSCKLRPRPLAVFFCRSHSGGIEDSSKAQIAQQMCLLPHSLLRRSQG